MRGAGSTSLLGRAVLQQPFSHLLMLLGQFGPRLRHDQAAVEPELHICFIPYRFLEFGLGKGGHLTLAMELAYMSEVTETARGGYLPEPCANITPSTEGSLFPTEK